MKITTKGAEDEAKAMGQKRAASRGCCGPKKSKKQNQSGKNDDSDSDVELDHV